MDGIRAYLQEKGEFLFVLLTWLLGGLYLDLAGMLPILVISLLLFYNKGMTEELLIGFFFILILSDNRHPDMEFAVTAKKIYLVFLAFYYFANRDRFEQYPNLLRFLLPFWILGFLLLFRSEAPFIAFQKTLSYGLLFLVVPPMFLESYEEGGRDFLRRVLYFMLMILLAGFVLRVIDPNWGTLAGRYRGVMGNPNGIGTFVTLAFLFYVAIQHAEVGILGRGERLIFLAVGLLSLFLCGSRTAIFSVLIFFAFYYIMGISPVLGFVSFILLIVSANFLMTNLPAIILFLGLEDYFRIETLSEGSGRFFAWRFTWERIQEQSLFFGKGFYNTEHVFLKYSDYLTRQGHQGITHNSFLSFWLDHGLIGLLLYLAGFIGIFIRAARYSFVAFPIMFAVLFSANLEAWLMASLNPFTIIFVMTITVLAFQNPEEEEDEEVETAEEGAFDQRLGVGGDR